MMKRLSLLLTLSWTLAACAPAAVAVPTPLAAAPSTVAPTNATQSTATIEPVSATAVVIKDEFTPTDPTMVNLALGRP